jgi:hypothetical protein
MLTNPVAPAPIMRIFCNCLSIDNALPGEMCVGEGIVDGVSILELELPPHAVRARVDEVSKPSA